MKRIVLAAGAALVVIACATARQLTALRQVEFAIDRVASVRLAGINLDQVRRVDDLDWRDAARLAAAATRRELPLDFIIHVGALNPAENNVTARMVRLTWTVALNGRDAVSGRIDTSYAFPPGVPQDVAVPVQLDVYRFVQSNAADAIELALGLSGVASRPTQVSVTATPVIQTPLGAIAYPNAITIVRRTVGGP